MSDRLMAERAATSLENIRQKKPLIHNITNFVVMNTTANALLACGASPVMAHAAEEVEEMVSFAGALVLNIGTLTHPWVDAMVLAGKRANQRGIPIVLDPVGSGATRLRTEQAKRLMTELEIQVVRGNASEVLSLATEGSRTKGVDSLHSVDDAAEAAAYLAQELGSALAITGAVDLVTDGRRTARISNGHQLMASVTGTGCTATALIGAFLAVDNDPFSATIAALAYFGLAGEMAATAAQGPGTFQAALFDALYNLDGAGLAEGAIIQLSP